MEGLSKISNVILTGVQLEKVKENYPLEKFLYRLPGHVSVCVKDIEGENLVLQLDLNNIAASSGSACSSRDLINQISTFKPSHVLVALGIPNEYVRGSLRLTLGIENTEKDIDCIIDSVSSIVQRLYSKSLAVT